MARKIRFAIIKLARGQQPIDLPTATPKDLKGGNAVVVPMSEFVDRKMDVNAVLSDLHAAGFEAITVPDQPDVMKNAALLGQAARYGAATVTLGGPQNRVFQEVELQ